MRVLVPMAGCGQRFVDAGYVEPKPMIRLKDGKRILEHVVGMFDPSDDFVFIVNEAHPSWMVSEIRRLCRYSSIVAIPSHKLGPVHTVVAAREYIRDDEPVIIAYCDGAVKWDRKAFELYCDNQNLDGCLITHTGFHPHTLSKTTKMAFCRVIAGLVTQVKEKESFTDDPMSEHASSGVYWFRRGADIKKYFDLALKGEGHNGEHYVTLVYNLMIRDGLRVGVFDAPGVAILGTPAEVQNFEAWRVILRGEQVRSEDELRKCYRYWRNCYQ